MTLLAFLAASCLAGAPDSAPQDLPAAAKEAASPELEELRSIRLSLQEIARLMSRAVEQSSLDLLMKRGQIATSQASEAEVELARLEESRRTVSGELEQLDSQKALVGSRTEGTPQKEREAIESVIEVERKRITERGASLDRRIEDLRNRLTRLQEDARAWQQALDKRLANQ